MVSSNWGCTNWTRDQNTEIEDYYSKRMGLRGLIWTAHPAGGSLGIVELEVYSIYDPLFLTVLYGAVVSAYCCERSCARTAEYHRPDGNW